ncbi:leucine-rich repeat-containing protein 15-like [Haliotis rubra]|uniref:leucine-rich repeat-containing protein 15-like n=1 Tax=Haliotis rubra TaxID=36100 RepID=UPI001EE56876|nr:leucine-rich repeat-containing protein 15-like [Haliotis rubra]
MVNYYVKRLSSVAFLLACVFGYMTSQTCPSNCICAVSDYVTCQPKMTSFPIGLPANTTSINLLGSFNNRNSLSTLKHSALSAFSNLEDFYVTYSEVTKLDDDLFQGLTKLKRIALQHNKISQINTGIFHGLNDVVFVDLTGNTGCKIADDAFASLKNLHDLFLGDLNLGRASSAIFTGLTNLRNLDLHGNNFEKVSVQLFQHLTSLKTLDLSDNKLATIPDSFELIFQKLQIIHLSDNPWRCTCDIQWLKNLNQSVMYSVYSGNVPACAAPSVLKYHTIYHAEDKDFTCIPPKILKCGDLYTVKQGDLLHISCQIEGDLFPNVTWMRPDGTIISASSVSIFDPRYTTTRDVSTVLTAEASYDGLWTVQAANDKGKDEKTFRVHVQIPTTTSTTTTATPVESADVLGSGFLVAVGGFGSTVLLGLIIFGSVVCCSQAKKGQVEPTDTMESLKKEHIDTITFIVTPPT